MSDKTELLSKLDILKANGYPQLIVKNVSIDDTYEEIKLTYEIAVQKLKDNQEDEIFRSFIKSIDIWYDLCFHKEHKESYNLILVEIRRVFELFNVSKFIQEQKDRIDHTHELRDKITKIENLLHLL